MGDSAPYHLTAIQVINVLAVSLDPLDNYQPALLALYNATYERLDTRYWIGRRRHNSMLGGRQAPRNQLACHTPASSRVV